MTTSCQIHPRLYDLDDRRPAWEAMATVIPDDAITDEMREALLTIEGEIDDVVPAETTSSLLMWDGEKLTLAAGGTVRTLWPTNAATS